LPSCRWKVNAPGYFLQRPAEASIKPVRLTASPLSSVCPVLGGIIAVSPLPDFVSAFLAATRSPLPSGDFYVPLRIAAFDSACRSKAHLFELPDFPSLPAGHSLLNDQPPDHRSRIATSHQVRLFREPLGTLVIMLSKQFFVKGNL